jgi:undecaprenyl-diphosphatase
MKKSLVLLVIFIIFSIVVISCPVIDLGDKSVIAFIQNHLVSIPLWVALLPDCKLYSVMIALPILFFIFWFYRKKEYKNILFFCSIPLVTFFLNCIIKPLVHRARPPYEMQLEIHPHSFSYVYSHSLVTLCLWGLVIYFLDKYCSNNILKRVGISFSILWILFVGFSRIWLGVHNPTDVFGAYILGLFLLTIYIPVFTKGGNNE